MLDKIFVKFYGDLPYNRKEILRYAGVKEESEEIGALLDECIGEYSASFKVCYREFPVSLNGETLDLTFAKTDSKSLKINLNGCDSIILFAATAGIETDRLIAKYAKIAPSKSVMFQAIGTERIETLCNAFCDDFAAELSGKYTRPRFSPGYGDLPLELQKNIFSVLDCHRKIGISLNDNLFMSPSKSVTAIMGISNTNCRKRSEMCEYCEKTDCKLRG